MIHRENLIRKFNPALTKVVTDSPITVGNGGLAFTADVTGLQTLYDEYSDACPVLTMSTEAWHSMPDDNGRYYGPENITMTEYFNGERHFKYPVKCYPEESQIYDWLRQNPHRFNLLRLSFKLDGNNITSKDITGIRQSLDLYTGILTSKFKLDGKEVLVETLVGLGQTLGVRVESTLLKERLTVEATFPYGSPDKIASDFNAPNKHTTKIVKTTTEKGQSSMLLSRKLDRDEHYVLINGEVKSESNGVHCVKLSIPEQRRKGMSFCVSFAKNPGELAEVSFKQAYEQSVKRFYAFWNKGAIIDVTSSPDERAEELQRRIILSMYLTFIQCSGKLPPQETGLTCNSWYGRFHLEMHPIHAAYLALFGKGDLLERSFDFYLKNLDKAKEIAAKNGFKGARWPKMTSNIADQAPSVIAPLLIWQQPHLIYMLELLRRARYSDKRVEVPGITEEEFLTKYKDLISETAAFMADFASYDKDGDRYVLKPPMYSVQEKGDPEKIMNPPFELAYWSFGLRTAYEWMHDIGEDHEDWLKIADSMAKAPVYDGLLAAYEGATDTYDNLSIDHPSMLFAYGFISGEVDKDILKASIEKMKECWDFDSLWGWDFAFLAMTYAKLGMYDEAFDMILCKTNKNIFGINGNNIQGTRKDLPLYLPGNGALLLAMSALKSTKNWYVETEGIMDYPF